MMRQSLCDERLTLYKTLLAMAKIKGIEIYSYNSNKLRKFCEECDEKLVIDLNKAAVEYVYLPIEDVLEKYLPMSEKIIDLVFGDTKNLNSAIPPTNNQTSSAVENRSRPAVSKHLFTCRSSESDSDFQIDASVLDSLPVTSIPTENTDGKLVETKRRPPRSAITRSLSAQLQLTPLDGNKPRSKRKQGATKNPTSFVVETEPMTVAKVRPKRSCSTSSQRYDLFHKCRNVVTPTNRVDIVLDKKRPRQLEFSEISYDQSDHIQRLFHCQFCTKFRCRKKDALDKHVRKVHGFLCTLCLKPRLFKNSFDCYSHFTTDHLPYYLLAEKEPKKDYVRPLLLSTCISRPFHALVDSIMTPSIAKLPNLDLPNQYMLTNSTSFNSLDNLPMFKLPAENDINQWKAECYGGGYMQMGKFPISCNDFRSLERQTITEPVAAPMPPCAQMFSGVYGNTVGFNIFDSKFLSNDLPQDLTDVLPMRISISQNTLQNLMADLNLDSDMSQYLSEY